MCNMAAVLEVAALILWALVAASVYANDCRSPDVPSGVAYDLLEVEDVTIAYFYCQDPGLNPEPEQWICNSGSWDHEDVVCKGRECPDPPALENGNYDRNTLNKTQKGRATYYCNPGYKMQGRSYLICRREKTGEFIWKPNPHKMTCVIDNDGGEHGCDVPPIVEKARHNGEIGREWFPVGYVVRYTCGSGFIQSGPGQSTCLQNREWTTPEITCTVRNCGDPGRPDNGRRIGTVHTFGEQVTFECDPGYELSGNHFTFCQTNGDWSSPRPSCNPVKCPVVYTPDHGSTFGSSREYGAEIKVSCGNGYMIQGESVPPGSKQYVITCQANGEWDVWPVQCVEVDCGHITEYFPHGTMNEQGTKWQDLVTFRCNDDATMSGSDISECQENAQWSAPPPICWGNCRKPDVLNGKVEYKLKNQHYFRSYNIPDKMENGTLIRVTCNWGHDFLGSNPAVCHNKTWEYLPTCVPRPCNSLTPKTGMYVTHHSDNLEEGKKKKVPTATLR